MDKSTRHAALAASMTLGTGLAMVAAGMFWHDILDFMLGTVVSMASLAYFVGWVNGQAHFYE